MIRDLGIVRPGTTLYIPFHTFDSNDPSASVTLTGLATTDIEIYKDGSTTQRASDSGYALLDTDGIDFDATTGIHGISIDLADNTTAGFYAAGSQYWVVIASVTVDAATINFVLCTFRIGYPNALFNTTIATLSTQTSFTLTTGPAEDDALNGCVVWLHDVASAVQCGFAVVSDYTGASKTVTLVAGTTFTAAASDNISIFPPTSVHMWLGTQAAAPTVAGVPEMDLTHVAGSTTNVSALATNVNDILADTNDIQTRLPASLSAGRMRSQVEDIDPGVVDVTAAPNLDAAVSSRLAPTVAARTLDVSATGAAGIDWTNVEGQTTTVNLSNTVISETTLVTGLAANAITASAINTGAITAAKFAAGAIDAAALATDAVTELRSVVSGTADSGTTTTMVDAARTEADTDYWKDMVILFTSGPIAGQARPITAFTPASDTITFSPATTQAVGTNTYEIIPNVAAAGMTAPTAAEIADAVWDEDATAHQTGGTFGQAIGDPGADTNTIFKAVVTDATGATVGVDVVDLKTQIGTAGAGLTNINLPDQTMNITGDITGNLSGSVGSVTGAVGSVASGGITAASIATGAIDADALATDAVQEIRDAILPKINTALSNIEFLAVDSTDHVTPKTGVTFAGTRSIDGGAFGSVTGSIAEVGNGIYQFDASAADMNGSIITFRFAGSGADDVFLTIKTGG